MYSDINSGRISLQEDEKIKEEFRSQLNEILKGNPNYKSKEEINTIKNIKKVHNGREKVLNFIMIVLEWYLMLNTNQNRAQNIDS